MKAISCVTKDSQDIEMEPVNPEQGKEKKNY